MQPASPTTEDQPVAETPKTDGELLATAAKLAESDAAAFRAEGPRTDTKVTALLSLLAALIGTIGVLGAIATAYSRQSGAIVAAALLSVATAVLCAGLVMIVRLILPTLHHRDEPHGALIEVSRLNDPAATRAYYLAKAVDPLAHHALGAWLHARLVVGRYTRIRRAGLVLLVGIVLALLGGLTFAWGW